MKIKNLFKFNKSLSKSNSKKAQSMVEYVILFTVVASVVILAATTLIRPAINRLYIRTADSLDHVNTTIP